MNTQLMTKFQNQMETFEKKILNDLLAQHQLSPSKFKQIVITEVKKNAKMQEAFSLNPQSLFASIIHCAELVLSPSENLGEFFFIPYKGVVKPIIGYKGIVALLTRNFGVKSIMAECVYEGDEFDYELGLEPKLIHKPLDPIKNSHTLTQVYVVVKTRDNEKVFKVMSKAELMATIALQKQPNDLYFNDKSDPNMWMLKKMVLKQLAKLLPKDYLGSKAISIDDQLEAGGHLTLDENDKVVVINEKPTSKKNELYANLSNLPEIE